MKHVLTTLGLLLTLAALASLAAFRMSADPAVAAAVEQRDAMEWLRADFALSPAQFARIKQLHEAYSVVCEQHCQAIMDAARERDAVKSARANEAGAVAAAEKRVADLRRVCESAIAAHVRQCAAEMSPEAGRRYLSLVLPRVADFDHQAPPDLHLERHKHGVGR